MLSPRLRRAARALVVDPHDRVLLVQFHTKVWTTPGGGIDDGETPAEAARRELHEEVGYRTPTIGPPIWTRTHPFPIGNGFDGQAETVFLVRVSDDERGPALLNDSQLRDEHLVASAWWTAHELLTADTLFAPRRLPELVADLIAHGPPTEPLDAGI